MIADLHAHYPMHLSAISGRDALASMTTVHRSGGWDIIRALLLKIANNLANYPKPDEPAVTIPNLKTGDVRIVLSVLYAPLDEMDLAKQYGAPPAANYFADLQAQLHAVETDIKNNFDADAAVVHNHDELARALAAGRVALIHAIEGGFHLGDTPEHVRDNVHQLAACGVGYITVAHLFWRQVATNAPALPFLPDGIYDWWFPQPSTGLTDLGRAAIQAMVEARILIDLTHMSEDAMQATFSLLDEIDSARTVPVIATHAAYRFGKLRYNLPPPYIQKIVERDGVIGLIACDHYMTDGIRGRTATFEQSMEVLARHIDKIAGSNRDYSHIALGSDLDGFIKPTLAGLEVPQAFSRVRDFLSQRYGADAAEQICSGNAQRVLGFWRGNTLQRSGKGAGSR